jgi:HPt (histidine-containing phosphotransfer) domain-containing protein
MFRLHRHPCRHPLDDAGDATVAPAIDCGALDRLRQLDPGGRRGFLQHVLQTYERSLAKHLAVLAAAADSGDIARAGESAHTLKSSSASIGALVLADRCAEVERLARAGDAAALGAPLQALRAEAGRVGEAVQAILRA